MKSGIIRVLLVLAALGYISAARSSEAVHAWTALDGDSSAGLLFPAAGTRAEITVARSGRESEKESPAPARIRCMAVKTNLLSWTVLGANVGFEVQAGEHFSFDVPCWYSPWDLSSTLRFRLLAVQPEWRYWCCEAFDGHFFGLHAHVAGYNVSTGHSARYQDDGHVLWGFGLSYGYAFVLDGRWGVELNLGAGYLHTSYNKYDNVPGGVWLKHGTKHYWGITRAGITLSYKFRLR